MKITNVKMRNNYDGEIEKSPLRLIIDTRVNHTEIKDILKAKVDNFVNTEGEIILFGVKIPVTIRIWTY